VIAVEESKRQPVEEEAGSIGLADSLATEKRGRTHPDSIQGVVRRLDPGSSVALGPDMLFVVDRRRTQDT